MRPKLSGKRYLNWLTAAPALLLLNSFISVKSSSLEEGEDLDAFLFWASWHPGDRYELLSGSSILISSFLSFVFPSLQFEYIIDWLFADYY